MEVVDAAVATDPVVTAVAVDSVVTTEPDDHVGAVGPVQSVVARRPDDRRGRTEARRGCRGRSGVHDAQHHKGQDETCRTERSPLLHVITPTSVGNAARLAAVFQGVNDSQPAARTSEAPSTAYTLNAVAARQPFLHECADHGLGPRLDDGKDAPGEACTDKRAPWQAGCSGPW